MSAAPRSRARRCRNSEHRLTHDIDVWVASASMDGAPYLVPLSFDWDGEALLVGTPTDSPTGRNRPPPGSFGWARPRPHTGFDPRALATPYRWYRISPRRIQAWRQVNEMPERELMRDGRWFGLTPRTGVAPPRPTPKIG